MSEHIFICHATEDKSSFVRPLAERLRNQGARVWYDEFSMEPGSSLRESIDEGLATCAFGVVILSPAFFKKKWTQRELNGLVAREMAEGRKLVLPVWYGVTHELIASHSPPLADLLAIRFEGDFDKIVSAILKRLRLDDPYIQLEGKQYVRMLTKDGTHAKWMIERTVQVGTNPLSSMEIRVTTTGNIALDSVSPGTSKGIHNEGNVPLLTIEYTPPIPAGSVFVQKLTYDTRDMFSDEDNTLSIVPTLPYEKFTIGVQTPYSNSLTDARAYKVVGKKRLPIAGLERSDKSFSIEITNPEVGFQHTLAWKKRS